MRQLPRLHVITDECLQSTHGHLALARMAYAGGPCAVQLREKRPIATRALLALVEAARRDDRVLIVNDRADVAAAAGVGVHLGADDLPILAARRIVGPDAIVGATASSLAAVRAVEGADYVGVGPVFGTKSKPGRETALGLEALGKIVAASPVPVIAIGGITVDRVADVLATGAYGVAVLSAIVCADDPTAATAAFLEAIASSPGDSGDRRG